MAQERAWQGGTDGTSWMHRNLVRIVRHVPLRLMYGFVAIFVVPFYFAFSKGYKPMYHYFNRRLGYRPLRAFFSVYRNYCRFSQVILDRFYMFSGGKFDMEVENYHLYQELADGEPGFMILSAHVGCYELAGYTLVATKKRFNALAFGEEAEAIVENRERLFKNTNIRIIPVKDDLSHLFALNEALDNGESVSFPSDRLLGKQRTVECEFLGASALFPMGPFALAAQRDLPVLTVNVMKTSAKSYKVYVNRLQKEGETRQERINAYVRHYVGHLEEVLRLYPEQWFNYYEFWND
jgi:predicted LPLAT superfamily acyltransferase